MLLQADAAHLPLVDRSVHCVMTSPPYWGLRRYAGEQGRTWGGDPDCDHEWEDRRYYTTRSAAGDSGEAFSEPGADNVQRLRDARWRHDSVCTHCGAWYGALGLEPSFGQYVVHMVEVFREVRRVLRDDGVVWLNMGDCYAGSGGENANTGLGSGDRSGLYRDNPRRDMTLRPGNKVLMPHRLAIALQADGWYVRQDAVWYKRNPMPESPKGPRWERHRLKVRRSEHAREHDIKGGYQKMLEDASVHQGIGPHWVPEYTDCPGCDKCEPNDGLILKRGSWRHTTAHEYVFMLTKKMQYFSNSESVRERTIGVSSKIESQGVGMSSIVQSPYLQNEVIHFFDYICPQSVTPIGSWPPSGIPDTRIGEVAFFFVRTIFDFLELENDLCLRSLNQEIRQKFIEYLRDSFSPDTPAVHSFAFICASIARREMTPKQFMQQLQGLWVTHRDLKLSQKSGAMSFIFESAKIDSNRDATLSIDYTSRVRELLLFIHNKKYTTELQPSQGGRNPRSVLDVTTQPYKGAHYATFPERLVAPLIRTCTPTRCCPQCGQGWSPVVERRLAYAEDGKTCYLCGKNHGKAREGSEHRAAQQAEHFVCRDDRIMGYRPTCTCYPPAPSYPNGWFIDHPEWIPVPGLVLDPFVGSGTVGAVARTLGLRWVGVDLSMEYLDGQARRRARWGGQDVPVDDLPLFGGEL